MLLIADAALDVSVPPPPFVELGLLSVYHEAYTVGVAIALVLAGGLCLLVAALAWLALEPSRRGPLPADGAAVAGETEADQTAEGALAEMGRNQALR